MSHLYIIGGGAGSGKDTVAEMLADGRNGVVVAQADPMKRFQKRGFGFTVEQLWGPSSNRNAEDERFKSESAWADAEYNIFGESGEMAGDFMLEEIGKAAGREYTQARTALWEWFYNLREFCTRERRVLTPRLALQTFGTEFGRGLDLNTWSGLALNYTDKLLIGGWRYNREIGIYEEKNFSGHNLAAISDGRFRNEILNGRRHGGRTVLVINPKDESQAIEKAGVAGHVSEAELKGVPRTWWTDLLTNDKNLGLDHLRNLVDALSKPQLYVTYP